MWDIRTKKLKQDLPGHADEVKFSILAKNHLYCFANILVTDLHLCYPFGKVYAVDWSPDGEKVASGGKDRVLKLWMG